MDTPVQIGILRRAAGIVGGTPQLRIYLNVSGLCLGLWMSGADSAPTDVMLKAVDLICEHQMDDLQA